MVGGFNNIPEIDLLAQRLEIKNEFLGIGEIVCNRGQVLVIFNTETTDRETYPYYFANGMDYIFDILPKT
jgi:hypothetical protein